MVERSGLLIRQRKLNAGSNPAGSTKFKDLQMSEFVHQVCYDYVETYCSPYAENWSDKVKVLCSTLDKSYAIEVMNAHNDSAENKMANGVSRKAYIVSYELTGR